MFRPLIYDGITNLMKVNLTGYIFNSREFNLASLMIVNSISLSFNEIEFNGTVILKIVNSTILMPMNIMQLGH